MNETGNENKPKTPLKSRSAIRDFIRRVKKREFDVKREVTEKKIARKRAEREAVEKPAREQAAKQPYLNIPPDALLTLDHVKGYADRVRDNDVLADYYRELYEETEDPIFLNKAQSIGTCARQWFFDHYRLQRVRDLKSVFLCKDKFLSELSGSATSRAAFAVFTDPRRTHERREVYLPRGIYLYQRSGGKTHRDRQENEKLFP